jgi:mRNA interferase HigB
VRIFNEGTLGAWVVQHASAKAGLFVWKQAVELARWKTPTDIRASLVADVIATTKQAKVNEGDLRVIFNISGNRFRLVAHVNLARGNVFLKWFGTHAEYDKVDFERVSFDAGDLK